MSDILILCAHPDLRHSRANRALLDAARELAAQDAQRCHVRDLYALYPDYAIDVAAEQAQAAAARLIVWLHPIHWYGMPPLMKLWADEVLAHGWAYGHAGTALHGKCLWLVASTGGPEAAYRPEGYNRRPFAAFLPPYEQTAALCGLRWLAPLVLHGAHAATADAIRAHARLFGERLATFPAWAGDAGATDDCAVPAADRPAPTQGLAQPTAAERGLAPRGGRP